MLVRSDAVTMGTIVLTVLLVFLGFVLGVSMFNSDFANFFKNRAEAERMAAETEYQSKINEMQLEFEAIERAYESARKIQEIQEQIELSQRDTEHQMEIEEAETQAQLLLIQENLRHAKNQNNQQIRLAQWWAIFFIFAAGSAFLSVIGYLLYISVRAFNQRFGEKAKTNAVRWIDDWSNPNFRKIKIGEARVAELEYRIKQKSRVPQRPRYLAHHFAKGMGNSREKPPSLSA